MRGRQFLQGSVLLQVRQELLQGPERLQGSGLCRDVQGRLRGGKGEGEDQERLRMIRGFGLGLRPQHYTSVLESRPHVDGLEILSENYLVPGGKPLYFLDRIRELYPLVMHGVSLSIGSTAPLDFAYLAQLKSLAMRVRPGWI